MLYGMSIVYGVTGQTRLTAIGHVLATANLGSKESLLLAGILFIVVGFAFKVSAVPFQFWAPDTYEGAPVPVAAFLATASKAAGFAGLLQLMFVAFAPKYAFWTPVFATLSILTMTLGNLVALRQTQVVRLLAYSSIAQAGYMLLPFALVSADDAAVNAHAFSAAVTYILIYSIVTLGTFAVVIAMSRESRGLLITDFAGFGKRAPVLTVAMAVFMVSLAGVPPTAGFWGKFLIFRVAIEAGGVGVALAVIMLINSVISIGYYFAIPKQMIFVEGEDGERKLRAPVLVGAVAFVALLAVIAIGIYPNFIVRFPPLSTLLGSLERAASLRLAHRVDQLGHVLDARGRVHEAQAHAPLASPGRRLAERALLGEHPVAPRQVLLRAPADAFEQHDRELRVHHEPQPPTLLAPADLLGDALRHRQDRFDGLRVRPRPVRRERVPERQTPHPAC